MCNIFSHRYNRKMHYSTCPRCSGFKRIKGKYCRYILNVKHLYDSVRALERYRKFNMWRITEKSIKRYRRDHASVKDCISTRDCFVTENTHKQQPVRSSYIRNLFTFEILDTTKSMPPKIRQMDGRVIINTPARRNGERVVG